MGFRFRRSIRIAPGLRLNVSTRGLSTTIGARGASLNLGSRGAYLNVGLPGSGVSYREKIGGGRAASRGGYRQLLRELREQERAEARAAALEAHAEHEAKLEVLATVLARRNTAPYSWQEEWRSRGDAADPRFGLLIRVSIHREPSSRRGDTRGRTPACGRDSRTRARDGCRRCGGLPPAP